MARDVSKYVVNGERVPSVTEILAIAGMVDLSAIPPDALEHARQRGSDGHEWIESIAKGNVTAKDAGEELRPYLEAFEDFMSQSEFEIESTEEAILNERYRYAGTLDLRGKLNGKRYIIDCKLTAAVGPHVGCQLAGYAACFEVPHRRAALQLLPTGKFKIQTFQDIHDHHDFMSAVRVTHFKLRHGMVTL